MIDNNKIKPTLFLDFDETLVNTKKSFCEVYNQIYKDFEGFTHADHNNVYKYDFSDQCTLLNGQDDIRAIFDSEGFFNALTLKDDCLDVLKHHQDSFNYQIVTIGTPKNLARKSIWISNNLPFIENVILISNGSNKMDKSIIDMSNENTHTFSVFIDDHKDNLNSSNANHKFCMATYGARDWNEGYTGSYLVNWKMTDRMLGYLLREYELKSYREV